MDEGVETGCCDVEDGVLQTECQICLQRFSVQYGEMVGSGEMKEKLSMVMPK